MCSTTPKTKAASPAVKKPSGIKKHPPLPAIKSLQQFLFAAYMDEKSEIEDVPDVLNHITLVTKQFAISIRAIFKDQDDRYDNYYAEIPTPAPMYYTGSLGKVAAIYAAYELRGIARVHAKNNTFSNRDAFFNSLKTVIDTSTASQRIINKGIGLQPNLPAIFTYNSTLDEKVNFVQIFQTKMDDILENNSAAIIIHALGYAWINVSMVRGGFFNNDTEIGIWLAGDYSTMPGNNLDPVRTPTGNDIIPEGSAQNITTKEMSRLFYMIHTEQCYPQIDDDHNDRTEANEGAHKIIHEQGSWLTPTGESDSYVPNTIAFRVHCAKVGIGYLGPSSSGPEVISEGEVIVWKDVAQVTAFNEKYKRKLTGEFATVWQNLYDLRKHAGSLVAIISSAINNFLTQ